MRGIPRFGGLIAGPGHLQVSMMFGGPTPIVLDLIGARVRIRILDPETAGPSVIAGAITQSQIELKLYPGIQQSASGTFARLEDFSDGDRAVLAT
jgi:hypothetical protein